MTDFVIAVSSVYGLRGPKRNDLKMLEFSSEVTFYFRFLQFIKIILNDFFGAC